MTNTAFPEIKSLQLKQIDQRAIQKWANNYALKHAPKTVRNAHGFLTAVLYMHVEDIHIKITLPSKVKYDGHVPIDLEVQTLIE